jgi:hypothetical protein
MGASGWSYYVPYDTDLTAALERLHVQVFKKGEYYGRTKLRKAKTIAQLRERNREDGTHSILDITHIGARPAKIESELPPLPPPDAEGQARWIAERRERHRSARELHPDELVVLFGTTTPTRAQVQARELDLMSRGDRWTGTIVVIFEGERPSELLFVGRSGD